MRWRSSLWKLLWRELLVYTVCFMMISMVYRHSFSEEQQMQMEKLVRWCREKSTGSYLGFFLYKLKLSFRFTNHIPAWFLRVFGNEEVVGTVLQAALA